MYSILCLLAHYLINIFWYSHFNNQFALKPGPLVYVFDTFVHHMVQYICKDQSLSPWEFKLFQDRVSQDYPVPWDKQRTYMKPALLSGENFDISTLLGSKHKNMTLPSEPIYEELINSGLNSEHKMRMVNKQYATSLEMAERSCKTVDLGIVCGDMPRRQTDKEASSLMFPSLERQGLRQVNGEDPQANFESIELKDLWVCLFMLVMNITSKKLTMCRFDPEKESMAQFYGAKTKIDVIDVILNLTNWHIQKRVNQRNG